MWTAIVRDAAGKIQSKTPLKTGVVTIGRNADCDIVLPSVAVSRLHGRLLVGSGVTLIYSDERSANGSYVDGQPAVGAVDVGVGSVIGVGEFNITLDDGESVASAPAGMTSTMILKPDEVQLIPQAPPPRPEAKAVTKFAVPVVKPGAAAAPKPAAGMPKSAMPGFEFKNLDTVIPQSMETSKPESLSESIIQLLDHQIRGIQSHRNEQRQTVEQRKESVEKQWQDALVAARELQVKLRGNPRVLYYVISRDENDISIKLSDNSKRGHSNLSLSKSHPETGRQHEGTVWMCVFGEDPKAYREPTEALEDFVRRIASKLA